MDFTPTAGQDELGALARDILTRQLTGDRLRALDASPARFDPDLWAELARAGVLFAALPEPAGGDGLGLLEQCSVLIEMGRHVAPVPYLSAITAGASLIAQLGSAGQIQRWAVPAGKGELVIAAAIADDGEPGAATAARPAADGGWELTGTKTGVDAAAVAGLLLVTAQTGDGPAVFAVTPGDPGVSVQPQRVTGGDGAALVTLSDAPVPGEALIGEPGSGAARWLEDRATVGLCAEQLGIAERALELTAAHARSREQFGKPIGSFQAVSQRLADGYIDVEGMRLTLWQAAWRLAAGLPAAAELATAKFWAAEGGHRLAHTAVHVHGGTGIDTDGEIHRYYAAAKHREFALGGATAQLRRIGAALAG